MIRLLGLCGSLRAASCNAALLDAAARLVPGDVELRRYRELGALPLFNPDVESVACPPVAQRLRDAACAADGLVFASPEYAHGVSGAIKNALDWLVGEPRLPYKPVMVLNASPRATHAIAALKETLRTMSLRIDETASIALSVPGAGCDAVAIVADPSLAMPLRAALSRFADFAARTNAETAQRMQQE